MNFLGVDDLRCFNDDGSDQSFAISCTERHLVVELNLFFLRLSGWTLGWCLVLEKRFERRRMSIFDRLDLVTGYESSIEFMLRNCHDAYSS